MRPNPCRKSCVQRGWEGWGGGRRGYVLLFKSVSFLSTSAFCVFLTMRSPLRLGKTAQPLFQSRVDGFCCSNFKIVTSSTLWSMTAQQFRAQMERRAGAWWGGLGGWLSLLSEEAARSLSPSSAPSSPHWRVPALPASPERTDGVLSPYPSA